MDRLRRQAGWLRQREDAALMLQDLKHRLPLQDQRSAAPYELNKNVGGPLDLSQIDPLIGRVGLGN